MKKNISILVLLSSFLNINAQSIDLPTEWARQEIINNNIPMNTQGSRYFTDDFVTSNVYLNKENTFTISLRYDPINDEMQIQKDNQIIYLNKIDSLKITLNNKIYEIYPFLDIETLGKGYFINLTPKQNTQLLFQERKKFIQGKKAKDSYSKDIAPSFKDYKVYYLKKENYLSRISLSKKEFLKSLDDKQKELKNFISKKKLKLKNENDFVKIINYYNTL